MEEKKNPSLDLHRLCSGRTLLDFPIEYKGGTVSSWKWVPFWNSHNLLWLSQNIISGMVTCSLNVGRLHGKMAASWKRFMEKISGLSCDRMGRRMWGPAGWAAGPNSARTQLGGKQNMGWLMGWGVLGSYLYSGQMLSEGLRLQRLPHQDTVLCLTICTITSQPQWGEQECGLLSKAISSIA